MRLCGVLRSAFATRFRAVVGIGPISYLLRWRMALAKEALKSGMAMMEEVAFLICYKSASAFSTAFTRAVGCSPRRFHPVRERREQLLYCLTTISALIGTRS
ncbi:helix-turn-helix domain-containing protein [Rhizobium leguminosarum bv. viciae]|nr:helix-turn-helix domain-containing protein [Rhizobium leguminosarum bv. viciae]